MLRITPAGPEVLRIRGISQKAKVDGVLDEAFWKVEREIAKPAGGDFGSRAAFDAAWDGHTLYVGFRVLDSNISAKSRKPWENDSVELFLDYRNDRETVYNVDDRRIVVDATGRTEVVGLKRHIQSAARKTEGGYTVEIAVTGWNMGGYDTFKGKAIGFDVACNDGDASGKRVGRVVWHGTARNETDPSGFGTALFPE
jgi:endo-1,4-beta-xylanase